MIIDDLKLAAKIIADGGVAAFPTETVYGLGASAYNSQACAQIYNIKARPQSNPLIVHVLNVEEALAIGEFPPLALQLTKFWPGPLTIVVKAKKNNGLAPNLFAGLDTIAIRVPLHPIAQDVTLDANKVVVLNQRASIEESIVYNASNWATSSNAAYYPSILGKEIGNEVGANPNGFK